MNQRNILRKLMSYMSTTEAFNLIIKIRVTKFKSKGMNYKRLC